MAIAFLVKPLVINHKVINIMAMVHLAFEEVNPLVDSEESKAAIMDPTGTHNYYFLATFYFDKYK